MREGDDPEALGVETGSSRAGATCARGCAASRRRSTGGSGPTFEALIAQATPDESRPSIEFYRRFDEIDLLLPVAGE